MKIKLNRMLIYFLEVILFNNLFLNMKVGSVSKFRYLIVWNMFSLIQYKQYSLKMVEINKFRMYKIFLNVCGDLYKFYFNLKF